MFDWSAMIRKFGPLAVDLLLSWEPSHSKAISAVRDPNIRDRQEEVLLWLRGYSAFRGIKGSCRTQIVQAFLKWADDGSRPAELREINEICEAHNSLTLACNIDEFERSRPHIVSIEGALVALSRIHPDIRWKCAKSSSDSLQVGRPGSTTRTGVWRIWSFCTCLECLLQSKPSGDIGSEQQGLPLPGPDSGCDSLETRESLIRLAVTNSLPLLPATSYAHFSDTTGSSMKLASPCA